MSFIISLIIFIFINQIFLQKSNNLINNSNMFFENSLNKINPENVKNLNNTNELKVNISKENLNIWQIEIPSIDLIAPIAEGTSAETMNEYVGHFIETPKESGNIGLAAHNRGYSVNYFAKLKLLKENDLVIYKYKGEVSQYIVNKIGIIKDTDWSKLEQSEEEKLTLITCVEDEPEYRRYVQAIKTK